METGNVGSATGIEYENRVVMHGDADGHDAARCLRAERCQLAPFDRKYGYIIASGVDCQQPAAVPAKRDGTLRTQACTGSEAAGQGRIAFCVRLPLAARLYTTTVLGPAAFSMVVYGSRKRRGRGTPG